MVYKISMRVSMNVMVGKKMENTFMEKLSLRFMVSFGEAGS